MSRPPVPNVDSQGADAVLEIRVLGPLEVVVDGRPLVVDTRKAHAILALLAVERRPFARDELAAMLWPESDDEAARGALRRTLSVLRSALDDRWLRVDRAVVALDRDGVRLDLDTVDRALGSAELSELATAAGAARGPFLAGFSLRDSPDFDDWRATRAVGAERSVAEVLERLADAASAAGDTAAAIAAAARRVDLDPLDEASHRRLMVLLATTGDRTGAIRQYRTCVATLERELGVTPLPETSELYEQIRDGRLPSLPRSALLLAVPTDGRPPDDAVPQRLPLVGRDVELGLAVDTWRASSIDGRLLLVTGEAGIGKSRLVEATSEAVAAAGGEAIVSRAYAAEGGIAYGPIVDLLRTALVRDGGEDRLAALPGSALAELERLLPLPPRLARSRPLPAVVDLAADPGAHLQLLDAIATALEALVAGPVPGLVAVEDVHWADDASREAMTWFARRLTGRSLLLALTWRPEDLDELGMSFVATVESVPGSVSVPLRRLDREAVARLVCAAGTADGPRVEVDALYEESEGLPLFVVEALADVAAGGHAASARNVHTLLRERLVSVRGVSGQVLSAAAVLGRSFDAAAVRWTSGRSDDETVTALEELTRRGIVREVASGPNLRFDFAHARLRDAAYEATSLARRRLLHRRAAGLLRAEPVGRDDPARLVQLAVHERAAGRDSAAAKAFLAAGLQARALYAHHEATAHLETALALGHPDVAGISRLLGEIRMIQGDYAGALAALEASAAVCTPEGLPGVEVLLGRVQARRGDLVAAASHLDAAIGSLEGGDGDPPPTLARALVERAVVALRARELVGATRSAYRALSIVGLAPDDAAASAAHRVLGLVALERGDLDLARASLRRSLDLASPDPDPGASIAARNALALVEAGAGDNDAAIALLETALEDCRRTGERHLEAAVENNLADQLRAAGRPGEAMDHLKRAVTIFADVGGTPGELQPEIWKLVSW